MLTSDGLSLETFTTLWRDAMWTAVDTGERVRLVLELGRAMLRHRGTVTPQMVAFASDLDPPFSIFQLPGVPTEEKTPELRETIQRQLAEMGASEVFLLVLLKTGERDGQPTLLLTSWGETVEGEEACWMVALRHRGGGFEEASAIEAPEPGRTKMSLLCRGLLTRFH